MKRVGKILAIGITLGVGLSLIRIALDIDKDTFLVYYWMVAIVLLVGAMIFNVLYTKKYYKEMYRAVDVLNQGNAEEYIAMVSELEQKVKGKALKNLFRLNLTAGYCDLKQYEKALTILNELRGEKLRGDMDLVWRLNTCCCHFYLGNGEEGVRWYEENQKRFKEVQSRGLHAGNVAILELFYLIEKKRFTDAQELLEKARVDWDEPRLKDDYQFIEELLKQKQ